jgi:phosphohistidine swiveling domain-containing protein
LIEREMNGPVHVAFAVVDGCLRVLQARRARPPERVTFTCQMPFDRGTERRPALLHDLRGGIENQRLGMMAALRRIGLSADSKDGEIRYIDGAPYVDLELIRRAFVDLGRALLSSPSPRVLWGLLRPFPRMALPPVIDASDVSRQAWGAVKSWHETVLLPVARAHFEVATMGALAKTAHRLLRDSSVSERRAHPALVLLLARQRRRCDAEAARLETFLQASEGAIADFARALLARGVQAWDQMFSGDRHLHLGLSMIDQWIEGDEQARTLLDAKWRERRAALAKREGRPAPGRVHHPPLPSVPDAPDSLRAVGLVSGEARALAAPIARNADGAAARGAIAVLSEGTSDVLRHALSAKGIVLTGGGTLSPVATVAAELNIPAVYCPGARPGFLAAGMPLSINGALGVIKVR